MKNLKTLNDNYIFESIKECSEYVGVTRQSIHMAIRKGRLIAERDGVKTKIRLSDYNIYRESKFDRVHSKSGGKFVYSDDEGRYSPTKVGVLLSIPVHKIYYELRKGNLKSYRVKGAYVITKDHIEQYLEKDSDEASFQSG